MHWVVRVLTSSIGQKLVMSLSGLFLIVFLVVHLLGNLQLLKADDGKAFNLYTVFMTTSPIIATISYTLYTLILVHTVQGTLLYLRNRAAKGAKYAVANHDGTNLVSRYMMHLGTVIFIFLVIHMYQFWWKMKIGDLPMAVYADFSQPVKDLYALVKAAFSNLAVVIFYVGCMVILGMHLYHGFQSAFQSLGINSRKYTPLIRWLGVVYSIMVPAGFALIPIVMYIRVTY